MNNFTSDQEFSRMSENTQGMDNKMFFKDQGHHQF